MAKKKRRTTSKKSKKDKKKGRRVFALHKNRLFFGVFVVMATVLMLSLVQQQLGGNLAGMATSPVALEEKEQGYDLTKYEHKETHRGDECLLMIKDIPYIHVECVE